MNKMLFLFSGTEKEAIFVKMDQMADDIFSSLRQKIHRIISLYEEQREKNIELQNRNSELHAKLEELELKLSGAEKKVENLKLAKVLSSFPDDDIHDTKMQINRIVREIDKCIALLNR